MLEARERLLAEFGECVELRVDMAPYFAGAIIGPLDYAIHRRPVPHVAGKQNAGQTVPVSSDGKVVGEAKVSEDGKSAVIKLDKSLFDAPLMPRVGLHTPTPEEANPPEFTGQEPGPDNVLCGTNVLEPAKTQVTTSQEALDVLKGRGTGGHLQTHSGVMQERCLPFNGPETDEGEEHEFGLPYWVNEHDERSPFYRGEPIETKHTGDERRRVKDMTWSSWSRQWQVQDDTGKFWWADDCLHADSPGEAVVLRESVIPPAAMKIARLTLGLGLRRFAQLAGVLPSTVSYVETGRNVTDKEAVEKMFQALKKAWRDKVTPMRVVDRTPENAAYLRQDKPTVRS